MFRVDAQHSYAPPRQGPDWFGKILTRNKFSGSIYCPTEGSLEDALAIAGQNPYVRRVVPTLTEEALATFQPHPAITSVHLDHPTAVALAKLQSLGLSVETDPKHWPFSSPVPVALTGIPLDVELPGHVFVKLTGFRLPVTPEQRERLRRMLRQPGPERLMFASGWPFGGSTFKEALAAFTQALGAMPIELREQILGGTAASFYRL